MGAGSTLWAERKVRRAVEQAAARMQPESLAAEAGRATRKAALVAGRATRKAAEAASGRVRDAVASGRDEMRRREEELWADLAARGALPAADVPVIELPGDAGPAERIGGRADLAGGGSASARQARGQGRRRRPSRLAR